MEMVAGGCDKDCHRRRFRTKLIAMGMCGYDRVLIEPSGIFDMDEFFDALHESPLDRWYEIGNVITVVDAMLEENLSEDAEFILASEVADAGIVLLSKAQEAAETDIERTKAHLNKAMESVHCDRQFGKEIFAKDWNKLSDADFKKIQSAGYVTPLAISSFSMYSMPLYRSSVFSRTIIRSTFSKRVGTPGRVRTGRRLAFHNHS